MGSIEMERGEFWIIDRNRRSWLAATLCALLLIAVPMAWAWQLKHLSETALADSRSNPPAEGRDARRATICALASGYAPISEQPQVLLVNNPTSLPSLLIAQPGDLLLVYRQSGLMLLYDPLTDRILNRATLIPELSGN
jgi:hypothetical protein